MCQKDEATGERTEVEDSLFRHALQNLDVVYAHRGAVSFLSTALPDGFEAGVTLVPGPEQTMVPVRGCTRTEIEPAAVRSLPSSSRSLPLSW